jgi:hypothetical protein
LKPRSERSVAKRVSSKRQGKLVRAAVEQVGKQDRADGGQLSETAKNEIAAMELRSRLEEERSARLRQRKVALQGDVAADQRRLGNVEAVLDAWIEKQ